MPVTLLTVKVSRHWFFTANWVSVANKPLKISLRIQACETPKTLTMPTTNLRIESLSIVVFPCDDDVWRHSIMVMPKPILRVLFGLWRRRDSQHENRNVNIGCAACFQIPDQFLEAGISACHRISKNSDGHDLDASINHAKIPEDRHLNYLLTPRRSVCRITAIKEPGCWRRSCMALRSGTLCP